MSTISLTLLAPIKRYYPYYTDEKTENLKSNLPKVTKFNVNPKHTVISTIPGCLT